MFAQEVDDSSERDELSSEDELQDDDNDDGQLSGANLQELMLLVRNFREEKEKLIMLNFRQVASETAKQAAALFGEDKDFIVTNGKD